MRLQEEAWLLTEREHEPEYAGLAETLLSLANGSIGARQALDHEAPDSAPGVFHSSIYDRALGVRTAIVNLPSPIPISAAPADSLHGSAVIESASRRLSLRDGVLSSTIVMASERSRIQIDAESLVHLDEPDLVLTFGSLTVLEGTTSIRISHGLDWRFGNSYLGGHTPEVVTHNVEISRVKQVEGGGFLVEGATVGTGATIAAATRLSIRSIARKQLVRERRRMLEFVDLDAPIGQPVPFVRTCLIAGSPPDGPPLKSLEGRLATLSASGVERLTASHRRAWRKHWDVADVVVTGDEHAQATLRFGAFHLRQAIDRRGSEPAHIPARGLTSEYHSGHSFFNTEFFKLPYWTYVDPSVARRLLLFRYAGLEAAKRHAANERKAGARYPEEADREGEPAAPWRIWSLRTGQVAYEWSGREKRFLSAAVVWGLRQYVEATHDRDFLATYGLEMITAAAEYAESVLEWDASTGANRARSVMGGDEYHYHVDDNHLTNHLLAWSLRYAAETIESLAHSHPGEVERTCGSRARERARTWRQCAEQIYFPPAAPDGALQQHDGYFDLPDQLVEAIGVNGRPLLSAEDRTLADRLEPFPTRLVKEADVMLMLALFPDEFDEQSRRASYDFYGPRTVHESSLSTAPYGIVAAQLGEIDDAYKFFLMSGRYDLDFEPRDRFRNGLHLAAYAGAWQIVVHGFAGFRCVDGTPTLNPRLPDGWQRLEFSLNWRGELVRVSITDNDTDIWLDERRSDDVQDWLVNGERRRVTTRRK